MIPTRLALSLCLLSAVLILAPPARSAPTGLRRIAFIVDSWYPRSHADVIGSRFLNGYRLGGAFFHSPLTIATVFATTPRPNDQTAAVAQRHGFKVANSVAEALLAGAEGERLAVHGIVIATRADLPQAGEEPSPTARLQLFREVFRVLDQSGARVPIFVDRMLAPNWSDSQTIVSEARRRGIPLMAGSVLPYLPLEPHVRADKPQVVVAVASTPYRAFAFHAAEFLQGYLEHRSSRETGIASIREVGLAYWALPDRDQWGGRALDAALITAKTRRAQTPMVPSGLSRDTHVVLIQYVDGTRAVLAFIPRVFNDSEFILAVQFADRRLSTASVVLEGEPFEHFNYLVHAMVEFFTTGQPTVPIERALLTTGIALFGQRQPSTQHAGFPLEISYPIPPRR